MNIKKIEKKILELKNKLKNKAHEVQHAAIREAKETHEASLILVRMAKGKGIIDILPRLKHVGFWC